MLYWVNCIYHGVKDLSTPQTFIGDPLELGGTAISYAGVTPAVRYLFNDGYIAGGDDVLDYGAGNGRNAHWLRNQNVNVYSYDPYNGTDCDGWEGVSNIHPSSGFIYNVVLTSYVLNVVPENIEDEILALIEPLAISQLHITRNDDIFISLSNALERGDRAVTNFFVEKFGGDDEYNIEQIRKFAIFGSKTSRGFQRIPSLEDKGFKLIQKAYGHKIYYK
jgi:hypothetical protein